MWEEEKLGWYVSTISACMNNLMISKVFPWPIALECDETHSNFWREHCSYSCSQSSNTAIVVCSTNSIGRSVHFHPSPFTRHFFSIFQGSGSVFHTASDDSCGGGLGRGYNSAPWYKAKLCMPKPAVTHSLRSLSLT